MFQFKLLHRILPTNSYLYKCNLKETELCNFCQETKETILHLFLECTVSKKLWLQIKTTLFQTCDVHIPCLSKDIILGSDQVELSINYFIVLIKYYIYLCWCKNEIPNITGAFNFLKHS